MVTVLGKRTRGGSSLDIQEKRKLLDQLKQHQNELARILPFELRERVLPVLNKWDPKGNVMAFYVKNAHLLRNLEFDCDFEIDTSYGIWLDQNLFNAAQTWNSVAPELAIHFNWKNKNPSVCV